MRIEIVGDERLGEGGFLQLRRLMLVNVRDDGSRSTPYACDFVERPRGVDAVAVVLYARTPDGVQVLLRDAIRPALTWGRREPASFWSLEIVAGLLETGDDGEGGIRRRAAIEALEEAGYQVDPQSIELLGPPMIPTPAVLGEQVWLAAAHVDPSVSETPQGDGSPMEETRRILWLPLTEALTRVRDAKSELALRRLAERVHP